MDRNLLWESPERKQTDLQEQNFLPSGDVVGKEGLCHLLLVIHALTSHLEDDTHSLWAMWAMTQFPWACPALRVL